MQGERGHAGGGRDVAGELVALRQAPVQLRVGVAHAPHWEP